MQINDLPIAAPSVDQGEQMVVLQGGIAKRMPIAAAYAGISTPYMAPFLLSPDQLSALTYLGLTAVGRGLATAPSAAAARSAVGISAAMDPVLAAADVAAARAAMGGLIPSVASIAALKSLTGTNLAGYVQVAGYLTAGDGGGGLFRWAAADATTDDGGTVIAPTAGGGRFFRVYSGAFNVKWFGAALDGATDDRTAVQSAFNAANAAGGAIVFVPRGTCKCSGALSIYKKTTLLGEGRQASTLQFTHVGDGINSTWPINSSTGVWITVRDIGITCTNGANAGGGFVDVGGTYVDLWNVYIQGWKYGVTFDQTEIGSVLNSEITCTHATGGNIWLVNGADHTVGASAEYTNRITIRGNQLNSGASVPQQIIDDGGVAHTIEDNNFNAGAIGMRAADVSGLVIKGNEFEGHQACLLLTDTKLSGSYVGPCRGPLISGNIMSEYLAASCIVVDASIGGQITANDFSQAVGQCVNFSRGVSNGATGMIVEGNGKLVTGAFRTAAPFVSASGVIQRANQIRQAAVTYSSGTAAVGASTITPASMEGITVGTRLTAVNADGSNLEQVIVTAKTGTTFTATFASTKAANFVILGQTPGDEEAGTWTPVLAGSTTAGAHTYTTQFGHYLRRGNLVHVSCVVVLSAKDAAMAGGAYITGLPFAAEGITGYAGHASASAWQGLTLPANYTQIAGTISASDTKIGLLRSGSAVSLNLVQAAEVGATFQLYMQATYSTKS